LFVSGAGVDASDCLTSNPLLDQDGADCRCCGRYNVAPSWHALCSLLACCSSVGDREGGRRPCSGGCDTANVFAMEIGGSNVNLVDLSFTTTSGLSNGIFVRPGALNANLLRVTSQNFKNGLVINSDNAIVDSCVLSDNTAGGGLNVFANGVTVKNTLIARNIAVSQGGGATIGANTVLLLNVTFRNNRAAGASGNGGCLRLTPGSTVQISSCLFQNCSVENGPGLILSC
jgi:hypothetical protein